VVGAIGVVAGVAVEALSDADDSNEFVVIVAGLSILIVLAGIGAVAGWFGRERDDVVIVAFGAGAVVAVALAVASVVSEQIVIASMVLAVGVAVVGGVVGAVAWWIGNFICDARDLPTAGRLVAPAYADDHAGYPLWTTDAGPVDINGHANGEPRTLNPADIATVSMRSVEADGTERQINAYDDLITITTTDDSHTRLRLPYGTRGVGTATGGPDVIRRWLRARSGIDH
jgi:hypothetical protein